MRWGTGERHARRNAGLAMRFRGGTRMQYLKGRAHDGRFRRKVPYTNGSRSCRGTYPVVSVNGQEPPSRKPLTPSDENGRGESERRLSHHGAAATDISMRHKRVLRNAHAKWGMGPKIKNEEKKLPKGIRGCGLRSRQEKNRNTILVVFRRGSS